MINDREHTTVADDSSLDKILDRLPYTDGTGRRRFVSGGILLIGSGVIFFESIKPHLGDVKTEHLLGSPILLLAAVLILYALGSLVEMLAGLFLVRAASGVLWSVGLPKRKSSQVSKPILRWAAYLGLAICIPFYMIWGLLQGLFGKTKFRLPLERNLTPGAKEYFDGLPLKVQSGLYHPVGDDVELALKYGVDRFSTETDRRWARRLLGQAEDVVSVTTAFVLIAILSTLSPILKSIDIPPKPSESFNEFKMELSDLRDHVDVYVPWSACREVTTSSFRVPHDYIVEECLDDILDATKSTDKEPEAMDPKALRVVKLAALVREDINRKHIKMRLEAVKRTFILYLILIVFLFLYVGYFRILHNAVVTIVEALSAQAGPPSGNQAEDQRGLPPPDPASQDIPTPQGTHRDSPD